jgi:putative transcriptional regulator
MPKKIKLTPELREQILQAVSWERVRKVVEAEIARGMGRHPDAKTNEAEAEAIAIRVQIVRQQSELSLADFAERYRIPVTVIQDWEHGRRVPDAVALAYLAVIEHESDAVIRALSHAA